MDNVDVLLEPIRASLRLVGAFLPRILLAIVILAVGWLVAKALRFAVERALRAMNFHVVSEKAGVDAFLRQGGGVDTIRVLGWLVYALAWVVAAMIAANSLDLAYVTDLIGRVVLFLPKVIVAVIVLVFGAYFARFVATALAAHLAPWGPAQATLAGRVAQALIVAFAVLIALDQLGLGDIVRQTFLILVAALAFGVALAFGLGGRERAAELIARWTGRRADDDAAAPRKPVI